MKEAIHLMFLIFLFSTVVDGQEYKLLPKADISQVGKSSVIAKNDAEFDPLIDNIINQTNLDTLIAFVRILSSEDSVWIDGSRALIEQRISNSNDLAADYLKQQLASYNLDVTDQVYSTYGRNIYAVQAGYLYPEQQYIICAHYDAVAYFCADDNASGTAAVLEAARILSKYDFKYSLVYAFWDEEEIGLKGSKYYANAANSKGKKIRGVLNIDMIGWDGNNDDLFDIHVRDNANSDSLANLMLIVDSLYNLPLMPVIYNPGTGASDHASFWNNDYGAILLIEAYFGSDFNPYYHSNADRIEKFDLDYFHNLSKIAIGTISTLANGEDTFTAISNSTALPKKFALQQNYPNPFNPATTIEYQLTKLSQVDLSIYNLLGQQVATLVSAKQAAGTYKAEWDASGFASGVYVYKISTDQGFLNSKKLLLIK